MDSTDSKPRRRWLRFSLRTLLLVMTLIAVWCGLVMQQTRQQRLAVAAIRESGGRMLYDYEPDEFEHVRRDEERWRVAMGQMPTLPVYVDEPWEPQWLLALVGVDCFHRVKEVALLGPQATDETMEHVTRLTGLKQLGLYSTRVTDGGLKHVHHLGDLKYLRIANGSITHLGLARIGMLHNLRVLALSDLRLTDASLVHLESLGNLEDLGFSGMQVTRDATDKLRSVLPKLRFVAVRP